MKKILFLLFCSFFSIICLAQDYEIKGHLADLDDKKPLELTIIEIETLNKGCYTDSSGFFSIKVSKENLLDTIEIYSLGYIRKNLIVKKLLDNNNRPIYLKKSYFPIKEITVKPYKTKIKKIGVSSKKPWRYQIGNIFGGQVGSYIENKNGKTGFINAVSYYIAEAGHTNAPFRVRIYSRDKSQPGPGEDLLKENVIVKNTNGTGWFTVDLSGYNISFPEDGMFVMMERIYTNDSYYYMHEGTKKLPDGTFQKVQRKYYGQTIANVKNQKKMNMWGKGLGQKWVPYKFYHKGYINVMINADIEFKK